MSHLKRNIIGLFTWLIFWIQVPGVFALYSPTISRNVGAIRGHILSSQAQNGTGDLLSAINSIKAYNRTKREGGYETGISGEARVAQDLILANTYNNAIQNPGESLSMVFNFNQANDEFISNCLRDEIWGLEQLRDYVGQEMVRAYLIYDPVHGQLLKDDYRYIITTLDRLKKYGSSPNAVFPTLNEEGEIIQITSNEYFFGMPPDSDEAINLYTRKYFHSDDTGCPDGEFEQVFEQIVNSWKTVETLSSGQGSLWKADSSAWGSIWAMAEANAKIRARQWIEANQLTLSLGGESGGRSESIVKGNGWDKLAAEMETEVKVLENIIGSMTPLFDRRLWRTDGQNKTDCAYYLPQEGVYVDCQTFQREQLDQCEEDEKKAKEEGINCSRFKNLEERRSAVDIANEHLNEIEDHEKDLETAKQAFVYSISLDSISEELIYSVDEELGLMNSTIQQGYEGFGNIGGAGLPSLINEVKWVTKNQCVNKQ